MCVIVIDSCCSTVYVLNLMQIQILLLLFTKDKGSESLNLLCKKEQMSEDRCERFALGHKKGEGQ